MVHNRNKLIALFIGNLSNAILHHMLEQAIHEDTLTQRYHKESATSLALAKEYRAKINPRNLLFLLAIALISDKKFCKK